ncbi:MAG: sigma-70 family RNA polymerase sigma factor [Deltaproteobacteria bacterium]|nr:sigma-70 family RNA polymerase sigma factor [Deltaproteobacteria bacterium]
MAAYLGGDSLAFRGLFDRLAPQLMRLLRARVGREADAHDLVQQTFLQLHRARNDFRPGARVRPWVVTIAMNLARDLGRRKGRRKETELADEAVLVDPRPVAADGLERAGDVRRVHDALAQLPAEQRRVIVLHWFEGLSFGEIAEMLDATPVAVRVRAHRGYERLRKLLEQGGNSDDGSRVRSDT